MGKRILVSSNCQTGGIAAAIQELLPSYEVAAFPVPPPENLDAVNQLTQQLHRSNIWISSTDEAYLDHFPKIAAAASDKLRIRIPYIIFHAFHPDLCYAEQISSNKIVMPHYNSRIFVWCYSNQVNVNDALSLFNTGVFNELGYLNIWEQSVQHLQREFDRCDLNFTAFFLKIKRLGNFMYSTNHPRIEVLIAFAKIIALKLGQTESILDTQIDLIDALADGDMWPVYPPIGDNLGLPSSYRWKINQKFYSLKQYLEHSYDEYARQNILPTDIKIHRVGELIDNEELNRILRTYCTDTVKNFDCSGAGTSATR